MLGNFKGLGDWDEALVVAALPDGTYVLEYTDEGLIEEGVPASRIRPVGAGDANNGGDAAAAEDVQFREGETVLGNFKGLGDWDEALVVAALPDGTYVLEYTDEGLIEEGVPASRITKAGGADAEASAAMAASGGALHDDSGGGAVGGPQSAAPPPAMPPQRGAAQAVGSQAEGDSEGEEEEEEEEEEESDSDDDPLESEEDFAACKSWRGAKPGYCYKAGDKGVGYYKDVPLLEAHEAAEREKLVLTAPQLANWAVEVLGMPPSLEKADRYFSLFDLPHLRVTSLMGPSATKPPAPLFPSLGAWFDAQLPLLAARVPASTVEVTLRVFLAPQQSVRLGLQHVTFSVEWVRVSGKHAELEPLSGALLRRLGLADRRPPRVLMIVMYRAERNRITQLWADIDKEGLGNQKGATLDDVLVSDGFDRALELARKGGAQGALEPIFHNFHQMETISM